MPSLCCPCACIDREGNEVEDHYIAQIFNRSPSDYMNGFDFKATMILHLLMYGHHYAERVMTGAQVQAWSFACPIRRSSSHKAMN